MKRTHFLAGGLVLIALLSGISPQPEAEVEHPRAQPADVASIDTVMAAFYDSISGPPGQPRDWDRYIGLFLPTARLVTTRQNESGGITTMYITPDEFAKANDKYMTGAGMVDTEIGRTVDRFGHIAHVFSSYESKRNLSDPEPYGRGINSLQLAFDGGRWWILSVVWDQERPENPIPEKYLTGIND